MVNNITIDEIREAFPQITGLDWTDVMEKYFFPTAFDITNIRLRHAPKGVRICGICYYIASLNQTTTQTVNRVSGESLGNYSYTVQAIDNRAVDGWIERFNKLVATYDKSTRENAMNGVRLKEVPNHLRLDRRD